MQNATNPAPPPAPGNPGAAGRPAGRWPVMLETEGWADYALLDSGNGGKLEQYGPYRIVRPEGQAMWKPRLPAAEWEAADAHLHRRHRRGGRRPLALYKQPLGETWPMDHDGIDYLGRFTSFRHVGVFPEQATHWDHMAGLIAARGAAGQGAQPVRLYRPRLAGRGARRRRSHPCRRLEEGDRLGAREPGDGRAGDKPIRWICEDAMKFAEREERRGSRYDIILFDPPAYGRGPKGEVWQLFEDLPAMTDICRAILTPKPLAVVLTAYSIRASFFAIHALMRDTFAGMGGAVESGELVIREKAAGRALSTSLFSRWVARMSDAPRPPARRARSRRSPASPIRWSRTSGRWR